MSKKPAAATSRKRERDSTEAASIESAGDGVAGAAADASSPTATSASTSNFRNVSACDRCRNRKNRCDQKLPQCSNCRKAKVKCVGFDPVSRRRIPRSYVYYLETRVQNLEALLRKNDIPCPPPEDDFPIGDAIKPGVNVPFPIIGDEVKSPTEAKSIQSPPQSTLDPALRANDEGAKLDKLVSHDSLSKVRAMPDPRYHPSASGISFARIVIEAVKTSAGQTASSSERSGSKSSRKQSTDATAPIPGSRDSFFGLHTKPTIASAPFPEKGLGERLVHLYFEHANPQIPVLHRDEFQSLFDRVYAKEQKKRTPRELYMLNIVFAIGSGIIMDSSSLDSAAAKADPDNDGGEAPNKKRARLENQQRQPEEYHASAIAHLENFLSSPPANEGVSGGLEELQAVLLLASLALLRPVAPGLWYIIGVAVRLSVDLGLHFEDIDAEIDTRTPDEVLDEKKRAEFGQKQWTRDLRRRLWWCVFNMDRLVSSCVGRPVSINEAVVTTEFPSMLDDKLITTTGFKKRPDSLEVPSYKVVSRHYLRLRLLQSEIMQVLQHKQADQARNMGAHQRNQFLYPDLMSSFLHRFQGDFREWRKDINRRLDDWRTSAPDQKMSGVAFNPHFYELNYWQAVIMLYRQSLSVPEPLASELSVETGQEVQSPGALQHHEFEEDKQMVFSKVAHAGHMVLRTYRTLHRDRLVNYTFLATHHLFISGISFLYALWHSPLARSQFTVEEVDFTVLAATSVLSDLSDKCPPAEACRDAFERMSRETISHVMKTTKFGTGATMAAASSSSSAAYLENASRLRAEPALMYRARDARMPRFDYNLKSLFSDEEIASHLHAHFMPDGSSATHLPVMSGQRSQQGSSGPLGLDAGISAYRQPAHMQGSSDASSRIVLENHGRPYEAEPQTADGHNATSPRLQPPLPQKQVSEPSEQFDLGDLDFHYLTAFSDHGPGSNVWGDDFGGGAMDLGFGSTGVDGSAWDSALEPLDPFFFGDSMNGF